jgi:hypothetical protein
MHSLIWQLGEWSATRPVRFSPVKVSLIPSEEEAG